MRGEYSLKQSQGMPQGLKPTFLVGAFVARLKPCPFKTPGREVFVSGGSKTPWREGSFSARCKAVSFQSRVRGVRFGSVAIVALLAVASSVQPSPIAAQDAAKSSTTSHPLTSTEGIEIVDGKMDVVEHNGRRALKLIRSDVGEPDRSMLAIVAAPEFHDGTIEVDVSGTPLTAIDPTSRGFIGVSFRTRERGAKAEYFYLRPTNARCDDQLRRNHTLQYVSTPDYPWERLRKENPGVYESYADMETGAWTHMKIVVSGTTAQLYVNGASQPSLIVNDLKLGDSRGAIGLWAHEATDAYFSNLKITRN